MSEQRSTDYLTALADPQDRLPFMPASRAFADQTVRQRVRLRRGGSAVRLVLSNEYGPEPLVIDEITVSDGSSAHPALHQGGGKWEIPAGTTATSDPVPATGTDLVVSAYLSGASGPATYLHSAQSTGSVGPGRQLDARHPVTGGEQFTSAYWISQVLVDRPAGAPVVVAFGDSITRGDGTSTDLDQRYPDHLQRRLRAAGLDEAVVLNAGIGGNRVLRPTVGAAMVDRFDRDVLGVRGATHVLILGGTNDIASQDGERPSAAELLAGLTGLARRARDAGITPILATLPPFGAARYEAFHAPSVEQLRQQVNRGLLEQSEWPVVDVAAALADPADPSRIAADYDGGDGVHPGDTGARALAGTVDPALFASGTRQTRGHDRGRPARASGRARGSRRGARGLQAADDDGEHGLGPARVGLRGDADRVDQAQHVDRVGVGAHLAGLLGVLDQAADGGAHEVLADVERLGFGAEHPLEGRADARAVRDVVELLVQPGGERLLGRQLGGEDLGAVGDVLDVGAVDRQEQGFLGGKVAVEGAGADAGAPGDVVHGGLGAVLAESLLGSRDQPLTVAAGVGAQRAGVGHLEPRNRSQSPVRLDGTGGRVHMIALSANRRLSPFRSAVAGADMPTTAQSVPAPVTQAQPHAAAQAPPPTRAAHPRLSLAIIVTCTLMLILDATVMNVALPRIKDDLGFSPTGLAWVMSAYTLSFGGLLLLGGRAGDILGRRRLFLIGIAIFTVASLVGGLAPSAGWLLAARAAQGVGAAAAGPNTIALIATTFTDAKERVRALALMSAVGGGGFAVGLMLGGTLTELTSWRSVLFINVPFGIAALLLAPRFVPEPPRHPARIDTAGAVTATAGVAALVYALLHAADAGWSTPTTIVPLAVGLASLAGFIAIEARSASPLLPLRLFANRNRAAGYANFFLGPAAMMSSYFFLTQFLQNQRGYGAVATGLAFLPMAAGMFGMSRLVPRLLARIGPKPLTITGTLLMVIGLLWLRGLDPHSGYFSDLLGPLAVLGLGGGLGFVPLNPIIMADVAPADAGAAGGTLQTMQQIGSSLGLAVLVTVFGSVTRGGTPGDATTVHAMTVAFTVGAGFAAVAAIIALTFRRPAPAGGR
jgi:EmrB/QacA subfamily drug resistance transporter